MEIIELENRYYPNQLKEIKKAPKRLYIEGNKKLLKSNIISIVGSRICSEEGEKITGKFVKELVKKNIVIASGLAIGIDTIAHKATLKNGGKTIAVLPSGLNKIFPPENFKLYQEILQKDGLIISEYHPNEEANSKKFLERNRIVSGISLGILIVEAKYRSGTSVTARLAKEQGKEVFAIPHNLENKNGIGTNNLIKKGIAKLVTSSEDILKTIEVIESEKKSESKDSWKIKLKLYKNNISEKKIYIKINKKIQKLKELERKNYKEIYELIYNKINTADEICKYTNKEIKEINEKLLMMEIEGFIKKTSGGYKCI